MKSHDKEGDMRNWHYNLQDGTYINLAEIETIKEHANGGYGLQGRHATYIVNRQDAHIVKAWLDAHVVTADTPS